MSQTTASGEILLVVLVSNASTLHSVLHTQQHACAPIVLRDKHEDAYYDDGRNRYAEKTVVEGLLRTKILPLLFTGSQMSLGGVS